MCGKKRKKINAQARRLAHHFEMQKCPDEHRRNLPANPPNALALVLVRPGPDYFATCSCFCAARRISINCDSASACVCVYEQLCSAAVAVFPKCGRSHVHPNLYTVELVVLCAGIQLY